MPLAVPWDLVMADPVPFSVQWWRLAISASPATWRPCRQWPCQTWACRWSTTRPKNPSRAVWPGGLSPP